MIRIGLYAVALSPVVFVGVLYFPFITEKTLWFEAIIEVLEVGWVALALIDSSYRPRWSLLSGALAAFLVVVGIADAFGVDPYRSIFGSLERMDGYVLYLHLAAYFVIAVSLLRTSSDWRRYLTVSNVVAVVVALGALAQSAGLVAMTVDSTRPGSFLGSPTFLASYLLLAITIAGVLYVGGTKRGARFWYLASGLFEAGALYATGTRGALLGLLAGVFVGIAGYALIRGRRVRVAALLIALLCCIGAALPFLLSGSSLIARNPILSRYDHLSFSDYSSFAARIFVWRAALAGFAARPLFGYGQSNFDFVFDRYAAEEFHTVELWFDKPHNVLLEWLTAAGILGLLAYCGLYFAASVTLWRGKAMPQAERLVLSAGLVGYFVADLVAFDTLGGLLLLVTLFAYLERRSRGFSEEAMQPAPLAGWGWAILLGTAVVGITALVSLVFATGEALLLTAQAASNEGGDPVTQIAVFAKAISIRPDASEIPDAFAKFALMATSTPDLPDSAKREIMKGAIGALRATIAAHPSRVREYVLLGQLLDAQGEHRAALEAYEQGRRLAPQKQFIYFGIVDEELALGEYQAALADARTAYLIEPEFEDAVKYYARAAIYAGDDALARQVLTARYGRSDIPDAGIINAYAARGDYHAVETLWQRYVVLHPDDIQGWFSLAASQNATGDIPGAVRTLSEIARNDPAAAAQAQQLIRQISGR